MTWSKKTETSKTGFLMTRRNGHIRTVILWAGLFVSVTDQIKESSDKILKSVQCREEQGGMVERLQRQIQEVPSLP